MQRETHRNPDTDHQQGDLVAARQFVSAMQSEALYVSFLLTGDRQAAVALAETALLQLFEQSGASEIDIDRRTQFLLLTGKTFLRGDYKERIERDVPAGLFAEPTPARFGVDNRRTLLLAALGRLNERERLVLVLNDLCGLDSTILNTLLERRSEPLVAPMETARQRVRQSVDIPQGEPLRPLLVEATFDAPKINLWPRLEEPLTEIQRRQTQRSQIMTYGIVGLVAIVLLASIVFLFGEGLWSDGEAQGTSTGSSAGQEMTAQAADPTPALEPPVFAPVPTPAPTLPAGSVPGWFLIETMHPPVDAPNEYYRSLARYDPQQNEIQDLFVNEIRLAGSMFPVQFSPDGYQMTLFREDRNDNQITYYIDSFATDHDSLQWETELLTIERDPSANPEFSEEPRLAAVHTQDRVYVAEMTVSSVPTLTIHELFNRNGKSRGMVEMNIPGHIVDPIRFRGSIYLFAPENSTSLHLIILSLGDGPETWRAALYTLDRSEFILDEPQILTGDAYQDFVYWGARPTLDGRALYALSHRPDGSSSRVQFLDLKTGDLSTIELPFTAAPNFQFSTMTSIVSHDGQRMYVIDPTGASVAIINLSERRLERLFPLESGEFAARFGANTGEYLFGASAILSADGSELYVAAVNQSPFRDDTPWESGIWVIDTTVWRITGLAPLDGFIDSIQLAPQDAAIRVQVRTGENAGRTIEMVTLSMDGAPEVIERVEIPTTGDDPYWISSPSDLYRSQHSRSAAIDGIQLTTGDTFSTLPRLEVTTGPDIISAGQSASVEVRVLDPANGELLTSDRQDVRFDSAAGVTAIIDSPAGERQFLVLGQVEPGLYRGSLTVQSIGQWAVSIALSDAEGQSWISADAGLIEVAPTYTGSDGRPYRFELTTEPEKPVANRNTMLHLRLVDAETGDPKPDTVTLAITRDAQDTLTLSDLPQRIDVRFFQGQQGVQTATLTRVSNGVYEGSARFWSHGPRNTTILIQPRGQIQMTIPANTIVVEVG